MDKHKENASVIITGGGGDYLVKSKVYKNYHYSVLPGCMMDYLHDTALEMLKVIVPVFEQNNICYMICGGTLLGAFTTGKFIAWDDDIDICILDSDYDRALECLMREIPGWMCVQSSTTEPGYYHGWAKVRDRSSHVYPDTAIYRENGVWIDLYRLLHVKKSEIPFLVAQEHLNYLDRRLSAGDISEEEHDKRVEANNLLVRIKEGAEHARESEDSEETYIIWSASKIAVAEKSCFPRRKYMFEGIELYGFNDADEYLTRHYGEKYRTLPPDEQRRIGINRIILEEETS